MTPQNAPAQWLQGGIKRVHFIDTAGVPQEAVKNHHIAGYDALGVIVGYSAADGNSRQIFIPWSRIDYIEKS